MTAAIPRPERLRGRARRANRSEQRGGRRAGSERPLAEEHQVLRRDGALQLVAGGIGAATRDEADERRRVGDQRADRSPGAEGDLLPVDQHLDGRRDRSTERSRISGIASSTPALA